MPGLQAPVYLVPGIGLGRQALLGLINDLDLILGAGRRPWAALFNSTSRSHKLLTGNYQKSDPASWGGGGSWEGGVAGTWVNPGSLTGVYPRSSGAPQALPGCHPKGGPTSSGGLQPWEGSFLLCLLPGERPEGACGARLKEGGLWVQVGEGGGVGGKAPGPGKLGPGAGVCGLGDVSLSTSLTGTVKFS